MLVRVDAARHRLSLHHSAAFGGMQRRNGGGGFIGGGNVNAARQLLLSLLDGAVAGRGQGYRGGSGGVRAGGWQSNSQRQRSGEWACACGFPTNRPHRQACYACGRARDDTEQSGAVGTKAHGGRPQASGGGPKGGRPFNVGEGARKGWGPVGADGARPLLGGRGRDAFGGPAGSGTGKGHTGGPSWNGKGPSTMAVGGKAAGRTGEGPGFGAKGAAKGHAGGSDGAARMHERDDGRGAWTRPSAVVDDEGFALVQPRRVRADKGGQKGNAGPPTRGASGETAAGERATRQLWADVNDDASDGDDMVDDEAGGDADEDEAGGDGEWEPDPQRLRAVFEDHARVAREMERRGVVGPALETVRRVRDEAERKWREAKPPAPLPRRLEWAEAKLRKAQATLTRVRLELDSFDAETDKRRTELCQRIEEAEGWHRWRQRQLDQIHAEAAERVPGGRGGGTVDEGAMEVKKRIRGQMLPELQAILEQIQDTELHGRLALMVAGLADAETKLGDRQGTGNVPAQFTMCDGDGDSQQGGWDGEDHTYTEGHQGDEEWDRDERVDDATEGCGKGGPTGWRPEGPGRWTRATTQVGNQARRPIGATTTTTEEQPQRPPWTENMGTDGTTDRTTVGTASGKGERTDGADGNGTPQEGGDGDGDRRAGKHRRRQSEEEAREEDRAASDARRAQELRRQLEYASAAQEQSFKEGHGGFGSEVALSLAAQKFVLDVQRAQAQANEMGVEPIAADGRTLLQLSPAELTQWIDDFLGDGVAHS